jgi:hypothetical protein
VIGAGALIVGVLITVAVHVTNRASWLLARLVGGREHLANVASAAHISRGWGGTGLLGFGSVLLAASLIRLLLPVGELPDVARRTIAERLTGRFSPGEPLPSPGSSAINNVDDLL